MAEMRKMEIIAIIPARGGSKGIPRKNLRLLAGKPLIAWMIRAASKSEWINKVVAPTEDGGIAEIAKKRNCIKVIPVGKLTFSKNKEIAKKFVDFVASAEGKTIFEECGFTTYPNPKYKE